MLRGDFVPSRHVDRKRSGRGAAVSASRWLGGAFEKVIEAKESRRHTEDFPSSAITGDECHRSRLYKGHSMGHGSIASAPSSVAI